MKASYKASDCIGHEILPSHCSKTCLVRIFFVHESLSHGFTLTMPFTTRHRRIVREQDAHRRVSVSLTSLLRRHGSGHRLRWVKCLMNRTIFRKYFSDRYKVVTAYLLRTLCKEFILLSFSYLKLTQNFSFSQ